MVMDGFYNINPISAAVTNTKLRVIRIGCRIFRVGWCVFTVIMKFPNF